MGKRGSTRRVLIAPRRGAHFGKLKKCHLRRPEILNFPGGGMQGRCYAQYCRIRKVFHKRPLRIRVSTPHIIMYGDHKMSILFAVRKPFWQGICSVKLYSMLAYIYENNYMQLASCSSEVRASKAAVSKRKQNSARYQPGYFSLLPTANIVQ